MVNIKSTISFDEYNAIVDKVVDDCFPDGTYSPANYEISLRTALLLAFAPDFDLSGYEDNNALWERVMCKEATSIYKKIYGKNIYYDIINAIDNAIDYRIKVLTSGSTSMSDMALSKLFDVLTEKVEKIDTTMLTQENINAVVEAVNKSKDGNFAESLVDVMLDKGMLAKPNREIRRKNGQRTNKAKSQNITVTSIDKSKTPRIKPEKKKAEKTIMKILKKSTAKQTSAEKTEIDLPILKESAKQYV